MTQQKFKQIIDDEIILYKQELETIKKRIKQGDYNFTSNELTKFFRQQNEFYDFSLKSTIDDLIDGLKDFKKSIKQHSKKIKYQEEVFFDSDNDTTYVDAYAKASWYELKNLTDEQIMQAVKPSAKSKLNEAIKQQTGAKWVQLDCKFVSLWLEEKIDFTTLCQISTANCSV